MVKLLITLSLQLSIIIFIFIRSKRNKAARKYFKPSPPLAFGFIILLEPVHILQVSPGFEEKLVGVPADCSSVKEKWYSVYTLSPLHDSSI